MELDQSILATLPLQQRQKVCRQIRQKQIEKYLQFERSEGKTTPAKPRKDNKKRTKVHFPANYLLQDAVDNFDDKEVVSQLSGGGSSTFETGNGTTLLHRCAAEDNVSAAKLLIQKGADVNARDEDWWTPLHTAASCDSGEVIRLLLKKGGDPTLMDVDGYFPLDHAPDNSDSKVILTDHLDNKGLNSDALQAMRLQKPKEMLDFVKGLPLAADVNQLNSEGVALLHIAVANGYKSVLKALLRYEADVNIRDSYGWTPLHVAARFNQIKTVEILLKKKANPNLTDDLGCKPSAIASSDEMRGLLMKYERKFEKRETVADTVTKETDVSETQENEYIEIVDVNDDDMDESKVVGIFRINSKTTRAKHGSISKEDELAEAKTRYEAISDFSGLPPPPPELLQMVADEEEEEDVGDYESVAIWKTGSLGKGNLPACMKGDNLVSLGSVQEETVLTELQTRYNQSQIYTYIEDILIAVNPFKELSLYTKMITQRFHAPDVGFKLPPHIYGTAENAYGRLMRDQTSQCCVISGESGAGKTESCKYIIQHLLRVAGSDEMNLSSKISQVNPLLEAFGNAMTVMNNNSSRFGKFVELEFTQTGKVTGAKITEYLLEKSRIVRQGRGECNFHIFYWMLSGFSPEEIKVYKLENMRNMRYLRASGTDLTQFITTSNKTKFWEVKDCLKFVGFAQNDIENVFLTLSTVLHLGEIAFVGVGNNDAAQVKNADLLQKVSDMLEVNVEELGSALVAEYSVTRGEQIKKERNVEQAEACCDALAKSLYGRLFSWIVNGINQLIQPVQQSENMQIGILDIFGFENFPVNSFEQLCINLANEQIQLYTNDHIFYKEQQDCLVEGVPLVDLDFKSNQTLLDLFLEKHTGVLAIMDEESMFPKATDKSMATKLHQGPGKKYPMYYKTPKDKGESFTVVHYAGSVVYTLTGILEKNRDTLPNGILYTMKTSNRLLIKELFQSKVTRTGSLAPSARQQRSRRTTVKKSASPFEFFKKLKGGKQEIKTPQRTITSDRKGPSTMAYHFRNSLSDLVTKLQSARPHFIRCLKPNSEKTAMLFVPEYVLAQLRYTGISDIIKIRKFGYAMRLTFHEFLARYKVLTQCCLPEFCPLNDSQKCHQILQHYNIEDVKIGKSKMFFKPVHVTQLDKVTNDLQHKVIKSQSVVRGFLGRQRSKKMASARNDQQRQLAAFAREIEERSGKGTGLMREGSFHDDERHQLKLKKAELAEINKSLESLDDLLNIYDDASSVDVFRTAEESESDVSVPEVGRETKAVMNGHIPRSLPPTPTQQGFDPSRPPPCPREMYSTGMYAAIEDHQVERRRQAPPPPKRDPGTRLSTTSVGSNSSGTYEELTVHETSPQHHHHHHHQYHHDPNYSPRHHLDPNQSPRHTGHGSPHTKSKFFHEPQSPQQAGTQPFSYMSQMGQMSPKMLRRQNSGGATYESMTHNGQNGQHAMQHQQYPGHSGSYHVNGQDSQMHYRNTSATDDMHSASPATSYGKQESVFHPQPHRPPPAGPPPPPPPGGQSMPSPKLTRHSVATIEPSHRPPRSPVMTPKLSQRSRSVPNPGEEGILAEPPPPVSIKEGYIAAAMQATGPPSPPLPPPPPEMLNSPQNSFRMAPQPPVDNTHVHMQSRQQPPPPVAPPTSYQGAGFQYPAQPSQPYMGGAQQQAPPPPPPPIATIPSKRPQPQFEQQTRGVNPAVPPQRGGNPPLPPMGSPPKASKEPTVSSTELLNELNRVQLKKTEPSPSSQAGEVTQSMPVESGETRVVSGVKLRVTPGKKLWDNEKAGLKTVVPEPILESPDPPPLLSPAVPEPSPVAQELPPPPTQTRPVMETATNNNRADNRNRNPKGDSHSSSGMEIDLDDIDLSQVPGYTPVTNNTPVWKRDMIEKKNQEKIEEYVRKLQREKEEREKWKNVPAWKRRLMEEKEKQKSEQELEKERVAAEEQALKKKRAYEAEERRREQAKLEKERELQMEEELKAVPAWKREIMMKRGGAIKNWGDEREDINEGEGQENEDDENMVQRMPSPPPQVVEDRPTTRGNPTTKKQTPLQTKVQSESVAKGQSPHHTKSQAVEEKQRDALPAHDIKKQALRPSLEEQKILEDWENVPAWKREIMMKRGGAPSNWGDEREDANESLPNEQEYY